jgi:hypothetical protein
MKKSENGLTKYLLHKSYLTLLSFFTLALVTACTDEEVNAIEEIQITGGHQVERVDGDFEFKYGLFNTQGQPTTKFNQGDRIIFSLWVINNGDENNYLSPLQYEDIFRVYKIESIDNRIDMGQPHVGMFCEKSAIRIFNPQGLIKFELPWVVTEKGIDGGHLWCDGSYKSPLEKISYTTAFNQCFEFVNGGQFYHTADLDFSIDFTVN